jgi:hypothetical protein
VLNANRFTRRMRHDQRDRLFINNFPENHFWEWRRFWKVAREKFPNGKQWVGRRWGMDSSSRVPSFVTRQMWHDLYQELNPTHIVQMSTQMIALPLVPQRRRVQTAKRKQAEQHQQQQQQQRQLHPLAQQYSNHNHNNNIGIATGSMHNFEQEQQEETQLVQYKRPHLYSSTGPIPALPTPLSGYSNYSHSNYNSYNNHNDTSNYHTYSSFVPVPIRQHLQYGQTTRI